MTANIRKVYLAGPDIFMPDPVARGETLKAMCARRGLVGLFPMDNEISGDADVAGAIRAANLDSIRACDAVVANMTPFRGPSMDPGTAYEMGVASALGKPVVGYTTDPRPYMDRVAAMPGTEIGPDGRLCDGEGMSVEDFGIPLADNLMMARGVVAMFTNVIDAIDYVAAGWSVVDPSRPSGLCANQQEAPPG